jgi:hypothetical protein
MDEAEWLACEKAEPMLNFLRDKADERKLRLLGCACCRRVWHLLSAADSRAAVEVAENFADGVERKSTLAAARSRARRVALAKRGAAYAAWRAALEKIQAAILHLALGTIWNASWRSCYGVTSADMADVDREDAAVVALIREIFGTPFRSVTVDPTCRTETVSNLAQVAYHERTLPSGELRIDRLALLADALEESGCDAADVLTHLRSAGPHVRGCWAVDLCRSDHSLHVRRQFSRRGGKGRARAGKAGRE